jgi:tyrosyl-tRNA synthetase
VFEGVPQGEISRSKLESGIDIIAALAGESSFLKSNGEARRALKENSISINKIKVNDEYSITNKDLINDRYVLLQRGKKTYFILKFV